MFYSFLNETANYYKNMYAYGTKFDSINLRQSVGKLLFAAAYLFRMIVYKQYSGATRRHCVCITDTLVDDRRSAS